MKKKILLVLFAVSAFFISSKAYAYWTDKLHFNVGIPVAYEFEISVITDEDTQEQYKVKPHQIDRKSVPEQKEAPLSVSDKEDRQEDENQEIKTRVLEEENDKEENIQQLDTQKEQLQPTQDFFTFTYNEGM